MKRVAVIGAGFAGLSAASCLAHGGFDVTIFEKNGIPGGRARNFEAAGFKWDMGPSWYWMPDVFEKYFGRFGKNVSDYYKLDRLDPSYRVYFGKGDFIDIPAGIDGLCRLFEQLEPGSSNNLLKFLKEGEYKYQIGINSLVYKPGISLTELLDLRLAAGLFRLHVFSSLSQYVRKFFKEPRIIKLLEFPVLFLGATADKTPALYSLMNYADMSLGTWYPRGGIFEVVKAMQKLAEEQGVKIKVNTPVEKLEVEDGKVKSVHTNAGAFDADFVVAGADYHHVEQQLLPLKDRRYSAEYWDKRVMAPSSLLFYLGIGKRLPGLQHHTLFFDEDFGRHAKEIYEDPQWPSAPQFYLSCTSLTDPTVAPEGNENLVILIPVATGLEDNDEIREKYFHIVMDRLEKMIGTDIRSHIVYKRSYAHRDFISDYHAFGGNAYGLANTLMQTAHLKPGIRNKKVANLFYTGQLTVPGPGVPPALISGQVVAGQLLGKV
ncbi:MAG: phytoene desaturase [Bacteroidetes bacterium]|nr:phytoene desaturase [Bacteroidota bacterium]MBS1976406.1 phytoene desaturase [Bacteroidota bacterium]